LIHFTGHIGRTVGCQITIPETELSFQWAVETDGIDMPNGANAMRDLTVIERELSIDLK
jgi:hypothetical protein